MPCRKERAPCEEWNSEVDKDEYLMNMTPTPGKKIHIESSKKASQGMFADRQMMLELSRSNYVEIQPHNPDNWQVYGRMTVKWYGS